jgi:hypothetical protein
VRGGARAGSGRPATTPTKSVSTRLNQLQRNELKRRGGAAAIKGWLDQSQGETKLIIQEFTTDEVANFRKYEMVRVAGKFNMFEQGARQATGLSATDYAFVMENFTDLSEASNKKAQK